jgi:hypothetical protein
VTIQRSDLTEFLVVLLCALVALAITSIFGLAALLVCRLLGTSEATAHVAEMIASGLALGGLVALFFWWGRRMPGGGA